MIIERFVVLEGLNGSGKSTIAPIIAKRLRKCGKKVRISAEPTAGHIGKLIRATIQMRSPIPSNSLPAMYVADRYVHMFNRKNGVVDYLKNKNNWEICSRYIYSSLAYQVPYKTESFIKTLNEDLPLPQFLFYIDIPPEISAKRLQTGEKRDQFEKLEILRTAHERYQEIISDAAHSETIVHTVDGTQPVKIVVENIFKQIATHL